ncbi:unnamed protein product [Rhizopus stolonifer]
MPRLCSICIHQYTNETFIRPCFHSFCFECICYWINTTLDTTACPICRQGIESIVYNINEEENEFDEYFLKDARAGKKHNPPLNRNGTMSRSEQTLLLRRQVYKGLFTKQQYPDPLPQHVNFTIFLPSHVPRKSEMNTQTIIEKLSEWMMDDSFVAERFLKELVAYIKSGLSVRDFISSTVYS